MDVLTICAAWLLQFVVGGPRAFSGPSQSGLIGPNDILEELGPLLSPGASITIPSGPDWDNLIARGSFPRVHPSYIAVVEVATEKDVQETVSSTPQQHHRIRRLIEF
jgi:hypothetical protein